MAGSFGIKVMLEIHGMSSSNFVTYLKWPTAFTAQATSSSTSMHQAAATAKFRSGMQQQWQQLLQGAVLCACST
jgi:hypothetical protein